MLYISVSRFVKTLAPIFRIVIIMSLTLTLVVNYCDDLNPLDNLRARLNGVRPIIFDSDLWMCIQPRLPLPVRWNREMPPWGTRMITYASHQHVFLYAHRVPKHDVVVQMKGPRNAQQRVQTGHLSRYHLK